VPLFPFLKPPPLVSCSGQSTLALLPRLSPESLTPLFEKVCRQHPRSGPDGLLKFSPAPLRNTVLSRCLDPYCMLIRPRPSRTSFIPTTGCLRVMSRSLFILRQSPARLCAFTPFPGSTLHSVVCHFLSPPPTTLGVGLSSFFVLFRSIYVWYVTPDPFFSLSLPLITSENHLDDNPVVETSFLSVQDI